MPLEAQGTCGGSDLNSSGDDPDDRVHSLDARAGQHRCGAQTHQGVPGGHRCLLKLRGPAAAPISIAAATIPTTGSIVSMLAPVSIVAVRRLIRASRAAIDAS